MKKWVTILFILISNSLLAQMQERDLKRYIGRITGVFSTYEQHLSDTTFDNVVVLTNLIRKDVDGTQWIYTEQGEFKNYKPYRKRVYELKLIEDVILQRIYYIKDESRFSYLNSKSLTEADIYLKDGCDIWIRIDDDGNYNGNTDGKNCVATFRGSSYVTTDFWVYKKKVLSWERGWDLNDNQMWGSTKGYYIFKK
jgi:hypothetical protein